MKTFLLLLVLSMVTVTAAAQDSAKCEVLLLPIFGKYNGECKGNKAHGVGKSVGMDTYEGEFKKGYPDGEGTYTWQNGNYYKGTLKKGLRHGKGEFHFLRPGLADSVVAGYWEKDVYKGVNLKPYIIHNTTTDIGRVQVTNFKGKTGSINITIDALGGGTKNISSGANVVARMTGLMVTGGSFIGKSVNQLGNKEVTILQQVIFPFRAVFSIGNSQVDIEFFEEGAWEIEIPVLK